MEEKRQRRGVDFFGLAALDYPVPRHADTLWYSLGGITLGSFIVAFLSGFGLTQFYNPSPEAAYGSVRFITESPVLGLFRGLHYWSVNIGFALLILHMLRVLFTAAYRPPRTVNYLVGVALLVTVFMLYFTGTVIRWDQEAYEALEHFLATAGLLGGAGRFFSSDFALSTSMLARMYGLHIAVLPAVLIAGVVVHLLYVRYFGISPKPFQDQEEYERSKAGRTFSLHLRRLLGYGLILFGVLLGLAYLAPPGLLNAPVPGVESTKPPWPFWVFYPLEGVMGAGGILAGSFLILAGLLLVPSLGLVIRAERTRFLVGNLIVAAGVIVWFVLLLVTYLSPTMKHL